MEHPGIQGDSCIWCFLFKCRKVSFDGSSRCSFGGCYSGRCTIRMVWKGGTALRDFTFRWFSRGSWHM
jgi:hypothetical protein